MKIHVNLALPRSYATETIEHAGTLSDPYSWSDVKKHLIKAARDGFDDGSNLDSNRPLDSDGFAVEFLCFGTGNVITELDKIDISSLRFSKPTHIVKFAPLDFWKHGLPVLSTSLTLSGSFISIASSSNLVFDFSGFIVDANHSAQFNLVNIEQAKNPTIRFHNNVVLSRGAGVTLGRFSNLEFAKIALGKNTVMVNSPSTIHHNLFDFVNTQVSTNVLHAANYVARHSATANSITVVRGVAGVNLRTSGNRYAFTSSFNDYSGPMTRTTLESDLSLNYETQGVFNDVLFGGSTPYSTGTIDCFFPVHQGLLLNACSKPTETYGIFESDPIGKVIGTQLDAGAFQKNYVSPTNLEYHVDLAQASHSTSATGDETSPLPLPDFLRLYSRLAPLPNDVTFHLRNENVVPVSSFDLGPLSPDTTASNRKYSGSGRIVFTSYKKHSLKQAVLALNALKLNADLDVNFDNVRLHWVSGTDFAKSGEVQNPGKFVKFKRCVLKSEAACTASVIDQANNACNVQLLGTTLILDQLQANLDSAGIFVNATGVKLDVALCIISSQSQNMGNALGDCNFVGTYVNGVNSFNFSGANIENCRSNTAARADVFVDPDNASLRDCNFRLLGTSGGNARDIILDASDISDWYEDVKLDARGLERDATASGGASSFDAGAYEFDYFIPAKEVFYVDFTHQGSASEKHKGTQRDRLSVANLKQKILELSSTVIDKGIEFVASGRGISGLEFVDMEFTDSGYVSIRNENPLAVSTLEASSPTLLFDNLINARIYIDGVIVKSDVVEPNVLLGSSVNTIDSKLFLNRSILWKRHRAYFQFSADNIFDVGSSFACGAFTVTRGVDWNVGATVVDTIYAIAEAFRATAGFNSNYECIQTGLKLFFQAVAVVNCDLDTDDSHVVINDAAVSSNNLQVEDGWEVVGFGSTVCEHFDNGVTRTTKGISHSSGSVGDYTGIALQGVSGKSGVSVEGASVTLRRSKYHGYVAPTCTLDNTTVAVPRVYGSQYQDDLVIPSNFVLEDGYNVLAFSTLPEFPFDVKVDIAGSYRSQVFSGGTDAFDVGAVEFNKLSTNNVFAGESDSAMSVLTPQGYSMDIRHDLDGLGFKIIGYTLNNAGYLYWQPNRISTALPSGAQASSTVTISNNTFQAGDRVSFTFGSDGLVSAIYNVVNGWVAGASVKETAKNILDSLNLNPIFRRHAYGEVLDNGLRIYAKRFGVVGNTYLSSKLGLNISVTSFQFGSDPSFSNKVWPINSDYAQFDRIETVDAQSMAYVARLSENQANFPIGELAIIGQVTSSEIAEEIGTKFVYAVSRFGLHAKHDREVLVKRFIFQY